jgi:hypothetical protein
MNHPRGRHTPQEDDRRRAGLVGGAKTISFTATENPGAPSPGVVDLVDLPYRRERWTACVRKSPAVEYIRLSGIRACQTINAASMAYWGGGPESEPFLASSRARRIFRATVCLPALKDDNVVNVGAGPVTDRRPGFCRTVTARREGAPPEVTAGELMLTPRSSWSPVSESFYCIGTITRKLRAFIPYRHPQGALIPVVPRPASFRFPSLLKPEPLLGVPRICLNKCRHPLGVLRMSRRCRPSV